MSTQQSKRDGREAIVIRTDVSQDVREKVRHAAKKALEEDGYEIVWENRTGPDPTGNDPDDEYHTVTMDCIPPERGE